MESGGKGELTSGKWGPNDFDLGNELVESKGERRSGAVYLFEPFNGVREGRGREKICCAQWAAFVLSLSRHSRVRGSLRYILALGRSG